MAQAQLRTNIDTSSCTGATITMTNSPDFAWFSAEWLAVRPFGANNALSQGCRGLSNRQYLLPAIAIRFCSPKGGGRVDLSLAIEIVCGKNELHGPRAASKFSGDLAMWFDNGRGGSSGGRPALPESATLAIGG
jgi:hypothetical protein